MSEEETLPARKIGRPKDTPYKHGFYYNKFKPCHSCDLKKNGTCPYYHQIPKREHLFEHAFDDFGVNRCVPEIKYFDTLKKSWKSEFELKPADEPLLDKMCMIMVRSGRVEEYIANEGLTQKQYVKNDKSGQIYENQVQNILIKDFYFEDKMLREWLETLKLSRKSREEEDNEEKDFALIFSKEIKIKAKLKAIPKEIQQLIPTDIQQDLIEDKSET